MTNPESQIPNPQFDEWIEIGTIVAPQGLNGEVRVYSNSDFPERFEEPGQRWLLRPNQTEPQPIELLSGRYIPGKGIYVVQLAGVEDRDSAEALRDCKLMVPASDRPILEEDEYHVRDLIGLEVFNQFTGENLGVVVELIPAGNDLLEVQLHQAESDENEDDLPDNSDPENNQRKSTPTTILIPFVKEIVPIVDLEQKRIEITPPPGLLEL
ncbi:MAG TPA: ribosome maturation factor RimM [Cyanobacteria bacterium UBA11369]|nr:ribosome maturation factor RimM [Cyanobacteria bacterium UBA11371]HBE32751.1 ribosome maturation factor RimM [Cyanobacteria bacterium UBA11368]HBE49106.1 ribosome maturation factor RimM [Cyanobacteria bacterium UBA11369]